MASGFVLFLPETCILVGALAAFLVSVFHGTNRASWILSLLAAAAALVAAVFTARFSGEPFAHGIYRVDLFSQILKAGIALGILLVQLLSRDVETVRPDVRLEPPIFLLLAVAGMMMLVSATELLTFYVALEMSAYSLYVAVAFHRDLHRGGEAAVKYVLFGAAASALTLYGLSLVFGAAGSTYFAQIGRVIANGPPVLLSAGLLLVFAGLFFKLALFPFHFWAPDVYEGAPHQIVAFIATASKLAAVGIIARVSSLILPAPGQMIAVLAVLAIVSMTLGNLAAIVQKDLKRLLGYSAVAHAGYLMLGYGSVSELGLASAVFYGFVYLFFTLPAFVVVCALGRDGTNPTLEGVSGLYRRSPGLAAMLLTSMFGLAGIPPTAGFAGKWFVFAAALQREHFWLVLIAAINGTIALYYYLRVVKAAYLDPPGDRAAVRVTLPYWTAGAVATALTIVVGVYPQPLWGLARRAAALLTRG